MFTFHRSYALLTLLLAASTVGASSLSAQEAVIPTAVGAPVAPDVAHAPTVSVAKGAPMFPRGVQVMHPFVELAPISPLDAFAFQDRARPGQNIFLMTIGGAALVTGLIMGGDTGTIIATTGAVVGLVGLFRYLG